MADQPKLILGDDWKKRDEPAKVTSAPATPAAAAPAGIQVDSDWKNQAQAERDRLAAEAEAKAASQGSSRGGAPGQREMPQGDFQTLVGTLVTQAVLYLGGIPDPETGRAIVSLEHARLNIDMLAALQEKTKGNLTPEETDDLQKAIVELRSRYVDVSHMVAEMQAKRAAGKMPGAAGGAPGAGAGGMMFGGGAGFSH